MNSTGVSFDVPAPLYEMLLFGFLPLGISLHPHTCEEGSCGIETRIFPGYSVVWATENLTKGDVPTDLDTETVGGAAVLFNEEEKNYEVVANDYNGRDRYGVLTREQAEDLIKSGQLG